MPHFHKIGGAVRVPRDVWLRAVRFDRLGWIEDGIKRGDRSLRWRSSTTGMQPIVDVQRTYLYRSRGCSAPSPRTVCVHVRRCRTTKVCNSTPQSKRGKANLPRNSLFSTPPLLPDYRGRCQAASGIKAAYTARERPVCGAMTRLKADGGLVFSWVHPRRVLSEWHLYARRQRGSSA